MTIHVTQEYIDKGRQGRCGECPIALAMISSLPLPSSMEWEIDCRKVHLWSEDDESDILRIYLPEECHQFVIDFDTYGPSAVSPFSFELPIERI